MSFPGPGDLYSVRKDTGGLGVPGSAVLYVSCKMEVSVFGMKFAGETAFFPGRATGREHVGGQVKRRGGMLFSTHATAFLFRPRRERAVSRWAA